MKKTLPFIWLVCASVTGWSCDGCGSGTGQLGWGIMPNNDVHFIGMRMRFRNFNTSSYFNNHTGSAASEDLFFRTEIIGRFALNSRLMLMGVLPYSQSKVGSIQRSGLGDASLSAAALVISPDETRNWKHALQIGIGAETPTGQFHFDHEVPGVMQQGSRSWDLLTSAQYTLRHQNWGVTGEFNWKYSGVNPEYYRYGTNTVAVLRGFWSVQIGPVRFLPSLALQYEQWNSDNQDVRYDIKVPYTEGYLLNAMAGFDMFTSRFAVGAEYGQSLRANIAQGHSALKNHAQLRFIYFIHKK
jgi:hypothetical protein